jgi:hypothetical protein
LTFEFGATVLLSSAVKCFEELLEHAHNLLTLPALADRRSNGDLFGAAIISISGSLLAVADPSSPQVAPFLFKSSGAQIRTTALDSSRCSSKHVITAVVRHVDILMLLQQLLKCRPVPPSRRAHITTSSISPDIRKAITEQVCAQNLQRNTKPVLSFEQARAMPLPEGVYFDGRRYVSFDGDSFDDHPCLAELLSAHVQQANADADVFNSDVVALERQLRAEAQVLLIMKEPPQRRPVV